MLNNQSIRIAVTTALLAACASVLSAPVNFSTELEGEPSAPVFTLQTETASAAAADARPVASLFATASKLSAAQRTDRQALAESSLSEADSQAALSLTLWSFARAIQAQQQGSPFEMLQTSLALQEFQITPQADITAVPLPGAVWLFVMGVLGLAGSRITRVGGELVATSGRDATRPIRGAVPA